MTQQTAPEPVVELENEDAILAYTHGKRKFIVDTMLAKGLPADSADTKVILTALKDMDGAALGRKRIKVEEAANTNQEQAAGLIAKLLTSAGVNKLGQVPEPVDRPVPQLGAEVPNPVLVPGETDTAVSQQSFETFTAEQTAQLPD